MSYYSHPDYKRFIEDLNNGNLDKDKVSIQMDNDSCAVIYTDENLSEDDCIEIADKIEEEYNFRWTNGPKDIVGLMNAIGIKADWC